jgi:hypothetical protein
MECTIENKINRIVLNVGGHIFETTKSTLLGEAKFGASVYSSCYFDALTSGKFGSKFDDEGRLFVFLDKDPDIFSIILKWLRAETIDWESLTEVQVENILKAAQYYQLSHLETELGQTFSHSNSFPNLQNLKFANSVICCQHVDYLPILNAEELTVDLCNVSFSKIIEERRDGNRVLPATLESFLKEKCVISATGDSIKSFEEWHNTFENGLLNQLFQHSDFMDCAKQMFYLKPGRTLELEMLFCKFKRSVATKKNWLKTWMKFKTFGLAIDKIEFQKNGSTISPVEAFQLFTLCSANISFFPKNVWIANHSSFGIRWQLKTVNFLSTDSSKKRKLSDE